MRLISPVQSVPVVPAPVSTSTAEVPPLAMTPVIDPKITEDIKTLQEQLQATQNDLKKCRQGYLDEFERQKTELAQRFEARLNALEKQPRYSEETMIQQLKDSLKKEIALIQPPAAAPAVQGPVPENNWDKTLRGKEKKLQDLKAELAQIPVIAMPTPAPVVMQTGEVPVDAAVEPEEAEGPMAIPTAALFTEPAKDLKKHLTQESTYATSSRSTSLFTKLWLYLNEPAIEIPVKNSKDPS